MAGIRVTLQLGKYPDYDKDWSCQIPLDDFLVSEVTQALDFPKFEERYTAVDRYVVSQLCTRVDIANRILSLRKDFAERCSHYVINTVLRALEDRDTVMGYKKEKTNEQD